MSRRDRSIRSSVVALFFLISVGALALAVPRPGTGARTKVPKTPPRRRTSCKRGRTARTRSIGLEAVRRAAGGRRLRRDGRRRAPGRRADGPADRAAVAGPRGLLPPVLRRRRHRALRPDQPAGLAGEPRGVPEVRGPVGTESCRRSRSSGCSAQGSVVVIDGHEDGDTGTIGSNNIMLWKTRGAVGVVTSGGARDTDEIIKEKIPLYFRGPGRGIRPVVTRSSRSTGR